jgi:mRNA interferase HigB
VRVVGVGILVEFWARHADARPALLAWLSEVRQASWVNPHEVRAKYPKVSQIKGHFVFNIHGNRYRLDVRIQFDTGLVVIGRAGTHKQYEEWEFPTATEE